MFHSSDSLPSPWEMIGNGPFIFFLCFSISVYCQIIISSSFLQRHCEVTSISTFGPETPLLLVSRLCNAHQRLPTVTWSEALWLSTQSSELFLTVLQRDTLNIWQVWKETFPNLEWDLRCLNVVLSVHLRTLITSSCISRKNNYFWSPEKASRWQKYRCLILESDQHYISARVILIKL